MSKPILITALLASLWLLPLHAHDHRAASDVPQPSSMLGGHAVYGQRMPNDGQPQTLGAALQAGASEDLQLISGRIGQICQKKGCWMMLIEGDTAVRVMFGKDDFFIPMDSVGEAIVHGRLEQVEMSEAHARHMAEDGGGDADAAEAGTEWRIVAVSVLIKAEA